jgi:hypothetical protein
VGLKDIAAEEEAADAGEDDHTADDDAEPEDDLNDPWEVLDLARAIYARQTAQVRTCSSSSWIRRSRSGTCRSRLIGHVPSRVPASHLTNVILQKISTRR